MNERATLTVEQAAEVLGVSRGLAYEAVRNGELPVVKLGRRLLIPRARLMALLGEDFSNGNGTGTHADPAESTHNERVANAEATTRAG